MSISGRSHGEGTGDFSRNSVILGLCEWGKGLSYLRGLTGCRRSLFARQDPCAALPPSFSPYYCRLLPAPSTRLRAPPAAHPPSWPRPSATPFPAPSPGFPGGPPEIPVLRSSSLFPPSGIVQLPPLPVPPALPAVLPLSRLSALSFVFHAETPLAPSPPEDPTELCQPTPSCPSWGVTFSFAASNTCHSYLLWAAFSILLKPRLPRWYLKKTKKAPFQTRGDFPRRTRR